MNDTPLMIAGKTYSSRLLVGSGKYTDYQQTLDATLESGAEIITVAIRRTNIGQNDGENLLNYVSPEKFTILPNTAGCYNAIDAVRTCKLARELLGGSHNLVKLEVLGDEKTLYPNIPETLIAAKTLVEDGFEVMVYTNDDPIVAKMLEEIGCVAIMPLGSLIGSGRGITNPIGIKMIKAQAQVPVLVDAGIGTPSDATLAMEIGVDAVLVNSAIAHAQNPILMANAMKNAVLAGRAGFLAKRMDKKLYASASSPMSGLST
jgi:thiazole synthase